MVWVVVSGCFAHHQAGSISRRQLWRATPELAYLKQMGHGSVAVASRIQGFCLALSLRVLAPRTCAVPHSNFRSLWDQPAKFPY